MLKPWRKGETGRVSNVASRYVETQQYARENSMKALRTLVERLDDADGRIAVVAANSILERAWGKTREQRPEEQQPPHIDLSALTAAELRVLVDLAMSGRLRTAPVDGTQDQNMPPVIDVKPANEQ